MNQYWYIRLVYFNIVRPAIKFRLIEDIPQIDVKYELENFLHYTHNQTVTKIEYILPIIYNEAKMRFSKFEHKINAYV